MEQRGMWDDLTAAWLEVDRAIDKLLEGVLQADLDSRRFYPVLDARNRKERRAEAAKMRRK